MHRAWRQKQKSGTRYSWHGMARVSIPASISNKTSGTRYSCRPPLFRPPSPDDLRKISRTYSFHCAPQSARRDPSPMPQPAVPSCLFAAFRVCSFFEPLSNSLVYICRNFSLYLFTEIVKDGSIVYCKGKREHL